MTYQELAAEIIRLPVAERLAVEEVEAVLRARLSVYTLGDLLHSEFFGIWKDREDIDDSVEFARALRDSAWRRLCP